ncbi:uncharacterized protein LOC110030366 isoform X1 [Phalaenopsis equestris]|uniref:uncharacterized protein LOC110030366 isoform X1 n=1 Tax=Phalaenopsis equestris TaxID=78828 RepID=UPI0009E514F9|nr:uncharacterized protein LOC110030366 isoform X1 [Phalaenopsis equestris]
MTRVAADAFGVATIALVALASILGLLCIYRCIYFQLQIQRRGFSHLGYFNGPWIIRVVLIIISIWWGFGEIVRLSLLRDTGRPLSTTAWCKFYVLSNLGFAEPVIFLMLGFLLHAALRKRDSDSLTQTWNWKTFVSVLLLSLPLLLFQLLVLIGPHRMRKKKVKFFMTSSFPPLTDTTICTYPLLSTVILGLFDIFVIAYVVYIGARMLCLVINKGLRLRVYFLALSVIFFLPLRVLLLGLSALPRAGNICYEVLVFAAFLMLLSCNMTGICMLVYLPVADSLALRKINEHDTEIEEIPCNDYYCEGASLIQNENHQDSTKRGSISFCAIIKDDSPHFLHGVEERRSISFTPLNIVSSAQSPPYGE